MGYHGSIESPYLIVLQDTLRDDPFATTAATTATAAIAMFITTTVLIITTGDMTTITHMTLCGIRVRGCVNMHMHAFMSNDIR